MKKFLVSVCVLVMSSGYVFAEEQVTETSCTNAYQVCEQNCEKQKLPDEKGNECYNNCTKEYEDCKIKINTNTIEKK